MSGTSAPTVPVLRCWAEIDLAALERNLRLIRSALPRHMRYVAVVKADAYGHGMHHVAARLMHADADFFAVANVAEAAALRELGPGWPILVLGPVLPDEQAGLISHDLIPTISSPDEVDRFEAAARAGGRTLSVHLKIDTGMGRLGVWHEQAPDLAAKIFATPHLRLTGVFTHFARPEDNVFTNEQRRRFLTALQNCRGLNPDAILVHADNSAGLESMSGTGPFNAVRIGLLQFGVMPRSGSFLPGVHPEPVFSFYTRVGLVKTLPRNTAISYGQTVTLTRETRVAILCAGYADGLPRAASNRADVLIRGQRCRILGRVTMDQTIVDVTPVPAVACGDEVVLVGRQAGAEITLKEFSDAADTIPWETLTSVTKRVPRLYKTALGT